MKYVIMEFYERNLCYWEEPPSGKSLENRPVEAARPCRHASEPFTTDSATQFIEIRPGNLHADVESTGSCSSEMRLDILSNRS